VLFRSVEFNVLRACQSHAYGTPVIVIADVDNVQHAACLTAGATVVLKQSISEEILDLQIRSLLPFQKSRDVTYFDLRWDGLREKFFRDDREIRLSKILKSLMRFLMAYQERDLSREQLVLHAWPRGRISNSDGSVDKAISRLRASLEMRGRENPIKTTHGVGYRLEYQNKRALFLETSPASLSRSINARSPDLATFAGAKVRRDVPESPMREPLQRSAP